MQDEYILMGAPSRQVTEQEIESLVHEFYARVRSHSVLGEYFARHIAEHEWPAHLARMCDFWSTTLRASRRYRGNPRQIHVQLAGLQQIHFTEWLALFSEVAYEVLEAPNADDVMRKATRMGAHLAHAALASDAH